MGSSFLIVGLGNPGPQYAETRHNIGVMGLRHMAGRYALRRWRARFKGEFAEKSTPLGDLMLLFPHTFMNLSGESVAFALKKLHVTPENLVVLHDDVDIPLGRVKVKTSGGAGGHNGLKSLINSLGTREFVRVRIGIGRPEGDIVSHVLGQFNETQAQKIPEILEKSTRIIEAILNKGATYAMNAFNGTDN